MSDQNNDKSLKEKELEKIREIDATIQRMGERYIDYRVAKESMNKKPEEFIIFDKPKENTWIPNMEMNIEDIY